MSFNIGASMFTAENKYRTPREKMQRELMIKRQAIDQQSKITNEISQRAMMQYEAEKELAELRRIIAIKQTQNEIYLEEEEKKKTLDYVLQQAKEEDDIKSDIVYKIRYFERMQAKTNRELENLKKNLIEKEALRNSQIQAKIEAENEAGRKELAKKKAEMEIELLKQKMEIKKTEQKKKVEEEKKKIMEMKLENMRKSIAIKQAERNNFVERQKQIFEKQKNEINKKIYNLNRLLSIKQENYKHVESSLKNSINSLNTTALHKTKIYNDIQYYKSVNLNNNKFLSKMIEISELPHYVINCSDRIDRKISVEAQLKNKNIKKYTFFDAIDKNDKTCMKYYNMYSRSYHEYHSPGVIGLILSTLELYKEINKDKTLDHAVIVEDDIRYLKKDKKIQLGDYDILYIGVNCKNNEVYNKIYKCKETNYTIDKGYKSKEQIIFWGTYGYICNRKFREKVISFGTEWIMNKGFAIDNLLRSLNYTTILKYGIVSGEHLVIPRLSDPDSLQSERDEKNMFKIKWNNLNTNLYSDDILSNKKFVFIIPSYNNTKNIEKNLNKILEQTYHNWRIIYINDCSTDDTGKKFFQLTKKYKGKVKYIKLKKNYKQGYCRYLGYNLCNDDEYCILLDGDDWLSSKYVLDYINKFININDVDLTYGSYLYWDNDKLGSRSSTEDYKDSVIQNKSYREEKWLACHLRVIKAKYLKNIKYKHLLDHNKEFLKCCTDLNESWSCLEQCNGRHKHINEIMMIYNKSNSKNYSSSYYNQSDKDKLYRKEVTDLIKSRKYKPYTDTQKDIETYIVHIDNEEEYENFKKDDDIFNEPDGVKILCIPSYLEHLYE